MLAATLGLANESTGQMIEFNDSVFTDALVSFMQRGEDTPQLTRLLAASGSTDKCSTEYLEEHDAQYCKVDADCALEPFFVCGGVCDGVCEHKKVFPTNA